MLNVGRSWSLLQVKYHQHLWLTTPANHRRFVRRSISGYQVNTADRTNYSLAKNLSQYLHLTDDTKSQPSREVGWCDTEWQSHLETLIIGTVVTEHNDVTSTCHTYVSTTNNVQQEWLNIHMQSLWNGVEFLCVSPGIRVEKMKETSQAWLEHLLTERALRQCLVSGCGCWNICHYVPTQLTAVKRA